MATAKKAKSKNRSTRTAKAKATKAPKRGTKAKSAAAPMEGATPPSKAQRWKGMSIAELQELHAATVGRPTGSNDRTYLIWKIREAEKGNVPVGPGKRKMFDGPTTMVTVKMEDAFLDKLDEAGKEDGFTSRLGYLRDLMAKGLQVRGRSELAAMVAV